MLIKMITRLADRRRLMTCIFPWCTLFIWSWALVALVSSFSSCGIINTNRFNNGFVVEDRMNRLDTVHTQRMGYSQLFMTENSAPILHHTAVKTRNITTAIQFYSLLGFEPTAKFKAGPARAAWLEHKPDTNAVAPKASISRIEVIEVPPWILNEPPGKTRRAFDLFQNQEYLGHNHLALDVTSSIHANKSSLESSLEDNDHKFLLSAWMDTLNEKSLGLFRKTLRVALEAEQFMVGNVVYERAFIYDADGALIELLYKATELPQSIDPMSGWENYDSFDDSNTIETGKEDKS